MGARSVVFFLFFFFFRWSGVNIYGSGLALRGFLDWECIELVLMVGCLSKR